MLITYCSCSPVVLGSSKALVLSFTTSSAGQLPSAGNRFIWIWVFVMRRQRVKWMQLWQPYCYHFKQLQPVFKQVMVHVTVACRQYNVWKNEAFILATISVKQVVRHAWSPYFSFQWDIQTMPISRFRFVQPIIDVHNDKYLQFVLRQSLFNPKANVIPQKTVCTCCHQLLDPV